MIEPLLARREIGELLQDKEFLTVVGILMATLLVGAAVLAYGWRKRQMIEEGTDADQLSSFRAMFERGELNQQEYERIRAKVAVRIKAKLIPKDNLEQPREPPKQEPDPTPPPT